MSSLIGRTIDTYEVHSVLGQGGMGIVYLARDTTLDREVALKLMDAGLTRDESFLKRFQSEAKALAKLQNPNIVSIYALRETEEGLCIVMEYVQGNTLADQLREQGTLPIDRTIRIFRQILNAFDHAHSAGIIHRDIKPGNILLTPEDIVKVTDFGLAKIQATNQATMTMGTGGTLYYMSPEQVRGLANVDKRGDIYSLGMTLFETLTGAVPFDSQTDFTIRQAIVEGNIPSPDTYLPSLPKGLKQVIMKSIARLPDDRYQTASEMWEALEAATESRPATRIAQRKPERVTASTMSSEKTSGRTVKIVGSIALLIVLAAAVYFQFFTEDRFQLTINTLPAGALVKINGESAGVTPLKDVNLDAGTTDISLALTGYKTVDTNINLASNAQIEIMLVAEKIEAGKAMLNISTVPNGAGVELNGNAIGVTPIAGFTLEPGEAQLRVSLDGYIPFDTAVQLEDGQTIGLPIALAKVPTSISFPQKPVVTSNNSKPVSTGTLSIAVLPSGDVTVNGETKKADAAQSAIFTVPAGGVSVSFRHPSYGAQSERVTIEAGKTTTLTYRWERRIIIGVMPTFANITVNNESIGVATLKDITKGPGRYKIAVSKPSWEIERIELNGNTVSSGDITISPGFDDKSYKLKYFLKEKL